jgi:hypothetical protein
MSNIHADRTAPSDKSVRRADFKTGAENLETIKIEWNLVGVRTVEIFNGCAESSLSFFHRNPDYYCCNSDFLLFRPDKSKRSRFVSADSLLRNPLILHYPDPILRLAKLSISQPITS